MIPLADELEQRPDHAALDTHTHAITICVTEDQAEAMAGGYVPRAVKSILRELLDFELEDVRRAERPLPKARTPSRGGRTRTPGPP